jgi:hypothetical protein
MPRLKAGMYARVMLPTGRNEVAALVPKDALVLGGLRPLIYVVEPAPDGKSGKARPLAVELGVSIGNLVQVKGGVEPRQLVVVKGNEGLRPFEQEVLIERLIPPPDAGSPAALSQASER